jgi:predicted metal-binding membrane protein
MVRIRDSFQHDTAQPQAHGMQPIAPPSDPPRYGYAAAAVAAVALACWAFLAWTAVDMGNPLARLMMPMSAHWTAANALAIFAMWALMMAAMMLPSAWPMIRSFVDVSSRKRQAARGRAFVGAYLLIWCAFSVFATIFQWALQRAGWVDPMIVSTSAWLTGALLVIAGVYQFSPLKRMCLAGCRTPIGFMIGEWRPGARGAWTMGLRHGLLCAGCCWALMALLFVGGAMNLAWVVALSIVVAIEKMAPKGDRIALLLGVVLIAAGVGRLAMFAH